jgi:hypothetical protein
LALQHWSGFFLWEAFYSLKWHSLPLFVQSISCSVPEMPQSSWFHCYFSFAQLLSVLKFAPNYLEEPLFHQKWIHICIDFQISQYFQPRPAPNFSE